MRSKLFRVNNLFVYSPHDVYLIYWSKFTPYLLRIYFQHSAEGTLLKQCQNLRKLNKFTKVSLFHFKGETETDDVEPSLLILSAAG